MANQHQFQRGGGRVALYRKHAFTLIEVLVSIAVVTVLLVLVTVQSKKVSESGQNVRCISRLKAISAGLHAYAADHQGVLPPSASLPNSHYVISFRQKTFWFDALNPYMGYPEYAADRPSPFPAPSEVGGAFPFDWQLCAGKQVTPLQRQTVGYGWNVSNFGKDYSTALNNPGRDTGFATRISQISDPGRTIIIGDSKDSGVREEEVHEHRYIYDYDVEQRVPYPERHMGRGNYLFLDGHVEALTPAQMKSEEGRMLMKKVK